MRINLILILLSLTIFSCSSGKLVGSKEAPKSNLNEKQSVEFGRVYLNATKERLLGNNENAKELFQKALQIDPNSAVVNYDLGIVSNELKDNESAFQYFKKANTLEPGNYWYKLSYATFLESRGQMEEAITEFKELSKLNPSQLELKYELAKLLVTTNRKSEGIKYLNLIEEEIGVNEELSTLKQRIYLSDNKLDSAIYEVEKLIEAYPNNLQYYSTLVDLYLSNGKENEVLEVFKRMQAIDSTDYNVQFALAEYYKSESNTELYKKYIDQAFSNETMSIDMKVKYLLSNYPPNSQSTQQIEMAIDLSKTLTNAHPKDAKSYAVHGDYLYFNGKAKEAKSAYVETLKIDSSRYAVWSQLLFIFSELEEYDQLINYGKRSIDLFPNQPTLYLLYGIGLHSLEKYQKAIDYYKLGADLVFDNTALKSQFFSSTGDAYHELGENKKSDDYYEKALELDPNNVYVLNNYSYYLSLREENLEKAKAMSLKSNQISPNQASFEDTYAWILYKLGEYEEALIWIDKALNNSNNPSRELLEHKGDILLKLKQEAKAIEFWQKALEKEPDSEGLKKKIKNINAKE